MEDIKAIIVGAVPLAITVSFTLWINKLFGPDGVMGLLLFLVAIFMSWLLGHGILGSPLSSSVRKWKRRND